MSNSKVWSLDEWKKKKTDNPQEESSEGRPPLRFSPEKKPSEDDKYARFKKINNPPKAESSDVNDWKEIRHARERTQGFDVGMYIQPPPIIFTRDSHNIFIGDMYRGSSAYLILGGPSFADIDKDKLNQAGVLTMGVNNSVRSFRPDLWMCVDNPKNFLLSTWMDPKIMKFVPLCHTNKKLFDNNKWEDSDIKVCECPNTFHYRRNEKFNPSQFLTEDTMNWGDHKRYGGGRSIMLPAVRMLFYLGVRTIFLLGCDFKMEHGKQNYHFEQDRAKGSVNGNNSTYKKLNTRFDELKPYFDSYGLNIYNCNKDSGLKSFDYMSFEDSLKYTLSGYPNVENDRTEGLYDREAKKKEEKHRKDKLKKEKERK